MSELQLLDGRQLQLIDLLYATGSVTRAADQLGQSQPTVSLWLARLREQLGDPLFVRTAQGMLPTPRTEALIGTVRSVLAGLRTIAEVPAA
ncbi:helix-turn-helix domain-containing protein, partial [Pseudacidovorax intermedius]